MANKDIELMSVVEPVNPLFGVKTTFNVSKHGFVEIGQEIYIGEERLN
jgi:hypothetical protein|tara:strand:- start:1432 stop:1575 length:144 start_codon:yes stop_codon:yes gene_type:complete